MARPAQFTFAAASVAVIAALQTTAGAGSFLINGSGVLVQPGLAAFAQLDRGVNRTVSITSTGNISARTFTVTGFDANGAVVTGTLAGPNNNTVYTTGEYNQVTSITVDGAVATNTSVGTGTTGHTNWYTVDYFQSPIDIGIWVRITATLTATVQLTPDELQTTVAPHVFNHANLTSVTADAASEMPYGVRGIRASIDSSSGSGALVLTLIQTGAGVV